MPPARSVLQATQAARAVSTHRRRKLLLGLVLDGGTLPLIYRRIGLCSCSYSARNRQQYMPVIPVTEGPVIALRRQNYY